MTFSDEKFLDPFTRVLTGYLGLPLRRSSRWTYVESINLNSSLRSRFNTCSPPIVLWPHELEQMITTKLGDMISRRGDIYWGNGYVNVTATKTGSAPIYHARAKFFAKAPLKDATVFVDLDITPSCNTTDGLQFAVSTPDIDVNLSLGTKFVRGIADIFTLGLAEIWIDTSPSAPKISSPATKTPICPVFSVGANDELKMKWPSSVELSALNIPAKSLPPLISPSTKVYLPLNPLCVDTSSIKLR